MRCNSRLAAIFMFIGPALAAGEGAVHRVKLGDPGGSPAIGPREAPVTLVAFIDYQCPFCERAEGTMRAIFSRYGDRVRIVYKQNPLVFHPEARLAAEAALVARELGGFDAFHRRLFENQKALGRDDLSRHAEAAGLSREDFDAILDSGSLRDQVEFDLELGKRIGVGSTPYFFINGRPLRGAKPLQAFSSIIDEELAGSGRPTEWLDRLGRPRPAAPSAASPPPDGGSAAAKDETAARERTPAEKLLLRRLKASQDDLAAARAKIGKLRRQVADLSRARGRNAMEGGAVSGN